MPIRPSIDDNNTTLVAYQGQWQYLEGSTRQWEGGVHSTSEEGASATFKFRGYQVWIWGTIPAGTGTNMIDVSIDGSTPIATTRTSNGSAVYDEPYYASPTLLDTFHTLVVTNRGSVAKGNSEFLLDRFEFETDDNTPIFSPPGSSPTSTSTTGNSTGPTAPAATTVPLKSASKTKVGGIVAGVVVALAVVIGLLLFLLWKRRRNRAAGTSGISGTEAPTLAPTPFPIMGQPTTTNPTTVFTAPRNSEPITEKSGYQHTIPFDHVSSPSATSQIASTPAGLNSSTTFNTSSQQARSGDTDPRDSHHTYSLAPTHPSAPSQSAASASETYEQPPPSYWHENATDGSHQP